MSRYLRPKSPGAAVFFTVCLADPGSDLLTREVVRLRGAVRATMAERPFVIEAMVVMPDHLHCIWRLPDGDSDFSTRWGAIKSRFTRSVKEVGWNPTLQRSRSKVEKGDAGIWQRRFWELHIRDEADWAAATAYCWNNPVKHGFVARAEDWPYSSVHRDRPAGMVV